MHEKMDKVRQNTATKAKPPRQLFIPAIISILGIYAVLIVLWKSRPAELKLQLFGGEIVVPFDNFGVNIVEVPPKSHTNQTKTRSIYDKSVFWINMDSAVSRSQYMMKQFKKFRTPNIRVSATLYDDIIVPKFSIIAECIVCHSKKCREPKIKTTMNTPQFSAGYRNDSRFSYVARMCPRLADGRVELACTLSHLKAIFVAMHYESIISHALPNSTSYPLKQEHLFSSRTPPLSSTATPYAVIMEDDVRLLFDVDFDALVASAPPDWGVLQLMLINPAVIESLYYDVYKNTGKLWVARASPDGLSFWDPGSEIDYWSTG